MILFWRVRFQRVPVSDADWDQMLDYLITNL